MPEATMINEAITDSTDMMETVSYNAFNTQVLEREGPMAVEFMSYGCSHCRTIEPVLQQVAEMVKSKLHFVRVNVAVEHELAHQYKIQGTPTLIMFLNGRQVGRIEGPRPSVSSLLTAVTKPFKL